MCQAILVVLLKCGIVLASVSVHYESLLLLSALLRRKQRWYSERLRAGMMVLGCLIAHGVEVILFGMGFRILECANQVANLNGVEPDGFNCIYYSVVVYTSIGFGDVVPISRSMRILTAAEGLTGAILVPWTVSFMFVHMQQFWKSKDEVPAV